MVDSCCVDSIYLITFFWSARLVSHVDRGGGICHLFPVGMAFGLDRERI